MTFKPETHRGQANYDMHYSARETLMTTFKSIHLISIPAAPRLQEDLQLRSNGLLLSMETPSQSGHSGSTQKQGSHQEHISGPEYTSSALHSKASTREKL